MSNVISVNLAAFKGSVQWYIDFSIQSKVETLRHFIVTLAITGSQRMCNNDLNGIFLEFFAMLFADVSF